VGAFSVLEDARQCAKKLLSQGFYAEIREKTVHESHLWSVTVAKEQNPFIDREKELREAGFSPFPVKIVY